MMDNDEIVTVNVPHTTEGATHRYKTDATFAAIIKIKAEENGITVKDYMEQNSGTTVSVPSARLGITQSDEREWRFDEDGNKNDDAPDLEKLPATVRHMAYHFVGMLFVGIGTIAAALLVGIAALLGGIGLSAAHGLLLIALAILVPYTIGVAYVGFFV